MGDLAGVSADGICCSRQVEGSREGAPLAQIAKDFGISEATLHSWLKKADIEDGILPGTRRRMKPKPAHPDRIWANTARPSSCLKTINPENQQNPGQSPSVPRYLLRSHLGDDGDYSRAEITPDVGRPGVRSILPVCTCSHSRSPALARGAP